MTLRKLLVLKLIYSLVNSYMLSMIILPIAFDAIDYNANGCIFYMVEEVNVM